MELESFLEPLDDPGPGGVDLYEAGEIMTLDMLSKWGATEDEPDWLALRDACTEALRKSRDLRPASYLAASLLHIDGLTGFCNGIGLLRGLTEQLWDDVHPLPDEDGDVMERASAIFNLTNFHRVLRPLRTTPLVEDRAAGRFSLLDLEIAQGKAEKPADYEGDVPALAVIEGSMRAMDAEQRSALTEAVKASLADLDSIENTFRDKVGVEQAPDMERLKEVLKRISLAFTNHAGEEAAMDDANAGSAPGASVPTPGEVSGAGAVPGEIRSRQDAVAAMERIAAWFRAHEPSSPVPLLMDRAKRLVDMDFLDILQDVAPDALDQVRKLGGIESDN